MNNLIKYLLAGLLFVMISCNPDNKTDTDDVTIDQKGTVVFNFPIQSINVPASGIHRIDLSLAKSTYDLYRGDFLLSANVSDNVKTYSFNMDPGDYYYQAGVTCTCLGDTCLWDSFPGGRFGVKWTMGQITVTKGETLIKDITFNK